MGQARVRKKNGTYTTPAQMTARVEAEEREPVITPPHHLHFADSSPRPLGIQFPRIRTVPSRTTIERTNAKILPATQTSAFWNVDPTPAKVAPSELSLGSTRDDIHDEIEKNRERVEQLRKNYDTDERTIRDRSYLLQEPIRRAGLQDGIVHDSPVIMIGDLTRPPQVLRREWRKRINAELGHSAEIIKVVVDRRQKILTADDWAILDLKRRYEDGFHSDDEVGGIGFDRQSDHVFNTGPETAGARPTNHQERRHWFPRWKVRFNPDGSLTPEDIPGLLNDQDFQREVARYEVMFSGKPTTEVAAERGFKAHTLTVQFSDSRQLRGKYDTIDFEKLIGETFCIVELNGRHEVKVLGPAGAAPEEIVAAKLKARNQTLSSAFKKIESRCRKSQLDDLTTKLQMAEAAVRIHKAYESATVGSFQAPEGTVLTYSAIGEGNEYDKSE